MDENPRAPAEQSELVWTLGARLDVASAAGLREEALKRAEDSEGDVVLDGTGVERLDGAALQVLLAFVRALEGRGRKVRARLFSPKIHHLLVVAGVSEHLGLEPENSEPKEAP